METNEVGIALSDYRRGEIEVSSNAATRHKCVRIESMRKMSIIMILQFGWVCPGCATAQTAPVALANGVANNATNIDQVLDALDARGKDFKTFIADVKLA